MGFGQIAVIHLYAANMRFSKNLQSQYHSLNPIL